MYRKKCAVRKQNNVSVTVMHQTSAHAYGSDGKKAYVSECVIKYIYTRCPKNRVTRRRLKFAQLHAPVAECPSRCQQTNYEIVSAICSGPISSHWFSHSALLSLTVRVICPKWSCADSKVFSPPRVRVDANLNPMPIRFGQMTLWTIDTLDR